MPAVSDDIASPCVNNCQLNEEDVCMGCYRSLQEIGDWMLLNSEQRLEVLQRSQERRKQDGMWL